jgi:hypothetical protein
MLGRREAADRARSELSDLVRPPLYRLELELVGREDSTDARSLLLGAIDRGDRGVDVVDQLGMLKGHRVVRGHEHSLVVECRKMTQHRLVDATLRTDVSRAQGLSPSSTDVSSESEVEVFVDDERPRHAYAALSYSCTFSHQIEASWISASERA